jgi:hypothetical protein
MTTCFILKLTLFQYIMGHFPSVLTTVAAVAMEIEDEVDENELLPLINSD